MKKLNETKQREMNGGAVKTMRCRLCGTSVTGNFWTRYHHCLKHSGKFVMSVVNLVATCFGLAGL